MKLKLSTRLILTSLLLSVVPLIIVSFYAFHISANNLEKNAYEKLVLGLEAKHEELREYLKIIKGQIITLAENTMVVNALKDFGLAFDEIEKQLGKSYDENLAANENLLKSRYAYQESKISQAPEDAFNKWWPKEHAARILQHYYIATNPYSIGKKDKLILSTDGSRYSQIHGQVHPILRSFLKHFGYYDIFLVDINGRIVYTVFKEVDFATNLINGPYSDSNLAKVFEAAIGTNAAINSVHFVDVAPYEPSYNASASFIAVPIFEGKTKIGVLIFQIDVGRFDEVMTSGHRWQAIGLGKTGEAVLVDNKFLLRSESRYLIENFSVFIQNLKETGVAEDTLRLIENNKTAIQHVEFKSPVIELALSGKSGVLATNNYLGKEVIVAYTPMLFEGATWAMAVSMEKSEAFAVLNDLRTIILSVSAILAGLAILIGWWIANSISNPITAMINTLSSSSSQIAATTAEHERIANQQAASVNETNTTMEELGISSKQSAQQAQSASDVVQSVLSVAEEGGQQVQSMLQGMEELRDKVGTIAQQILKLSEQTSQISAITGMMTDFANETKMLAMNAAVEAVRAGESGKGFSVLSIEIRKLAEESKHSTERINILVDDVQKATNATVMATEEGTKTVEKTIVLAHTTAVSFNSVAESMHNVAISAQQISLNIKQQAEAVHQVVVAMSELKTGAKEGAAGISQTKDSIKILNEVAQQLKAIT